MVGETPNLAARLQALAAPGSVVISQATRRLVGGLFELADLGPTAAQGLRRAARGLPGRRRGPRRGPLRGAARRAPDAAGRARARARHAAGALGAGPRTATARWSCSRASRGSASRACCGRCASSCAGEPHVALSHFCSPYHTNSALYPIIAQLERAAGFASDDDAGGPGSPSSRRCSARRPNSWTRRCRCSRRCSGIPTGERYPRPEPQPAAAEAAHARGPDRAAGRPRPRAAGARAVRGRALGRPLDPGAARPAGRAGARPAGPGGAHLPARVQPALDRATRTSRR